MDLQENNPLRLGTYVWRSSLGVQKLNYVTADDAEVRSDVTAVLPSEGAGACRTPRLEGV
jgi:hypothetical protein